LYEDRLSTFLEIRYKILFTC